MCEACYIEFGSPKIVSEQTRRAAYMVGKVYEHSCVGGNAHVVFDDWNLEDGSIRYCLDVAIPDSPDDPPEKIEAERTALNTFMALSMDERASALAIHDGFIKTT